MRAMQKDVTNVNSGIEITFTAPGDDFDQGTGNESSKQHSKSLIYSI